MVPAYAWIASMSHKGVFTVKVCLTSPPSPREKEAAAQCKQRPEEMVLRQVWEERVLTREPPKLAKKPKIRKTIAHIINPREITRSIHATDLAWHNI